jgi:tellurite resistance protein
MLDAAIDPEEASTMTDPTTRPQPEIDGATHRALGAALFNQVWALLEQEERTPSETDEMIHAAHASRFHWSRADDATPVHLARGEWQCSRVYAVLGRAEPSLWHARRCLAINEANQIADFDLAAAYEALARAHAVAGDAATAARWTAMAIAALDGITDPDDREVIERDIATLPLEASSR